jgi:hypothetical protein
MAIGAGISGQWFIVATPTGSNATTFHNVITGSGWSSSFTANAGPGVPTPPNWGTDNNYPTNSAFLPTAFVRNIPSNYPAGFYDYTNPNTGGTVQTEPQNIQLVAYPFQNTGSFRGDLVTTSSVAVPGANGDISLTDANLGSLPISYASITSMSFADKDIAGVTQTTTFADIKIGDQILLRNLTENEIATYQVLSTRNTLPGLGNNAFSVSQISGPGGNPIVGSDIFIDFVRTGSQQKMFIVAGAANPNGSQRFADQFSTGSVGASGDFRSGIIKFYATESNNEADWDYLVKQLVGYEGATSTPSSLFTQFNLFMFTGSAGVSSSYYFINVDGA